MLRPNHRCLLHHFCASRSGNLLVLAGTAAIAFVGGVAHAGGPRVCEIPGSPRIEFLAEARIAGTATDKSGLTGKDRSGVDQNLFGSWGSGIDLVSATVQDGTVTGELLAVCDRGPFDGASSFACRAQRLSFSLALPASESASQGAFTLTNTQTVLLVAGGKEATNTQLVGSLDAVEAVLDVPTLDLATGEESTTKQPARLDPESIRIVPAANDARQIKAGMWWVSDEYGPWIDLFEPAEASQPVATATLVRRLMLPGRYRVQNPGATYEAEMPPTNTTGRAPNRGLESLAVSADGKTLYAMTQSPLMQDGLFEGTKRGGQNIRLLVIDLAGKKTEPAEGATGASQPAMREFVYQLSHRSNGTNELLVWDENTLLVLERCSNKGDKAKKRMLYAIDLAQLASKATDVVVIDELPQRDLPATITPLAKQPWLDMLDSGLGLAGATMPEKIEGIAKGPKLADGRTLLFVSSDNDLVADQESVVWAFAVDAHVVAMP